MTHKAETFNDEAFPSHTTHELNILFMCKLEQSSVYQHAIHLFIMNPHRKMHNMTQKEKGQNFMFIAQFSVKFTIRICKNTHFAKLHFKSTNLNR